MIKKSHVCAYIFGYIVAHIAVTYFLHGNPAFDEYLVNELPAMFFMGITLVILVLTNRNEYQ